MSGSRPRRPTIKEGPLRRAFPLPLGMFPTPASSARIVAVPFGPRQAPRDHRVEGVGFLATLGPACARVRAIDIGGFRDAEAVEPRIGEERYQRASLDSACMVPSSGCSRSRSAASRTCGST